MNYRFRTNIFGKLILQVQDSYLRNGFSFHRCYYWRDAKLEDIDIEMLNLIKEK
jgi:hypothetical protein